MTTWTIPGSSAGTWTPTPDVTGGFDLTMTINDIALSAVDGEAFFAGLSNGAVTMTFTIDAWAELAAGGNSWVGVGGGNASWGTATASNPTWVTP